jgi:hypothetical protein
LKTILPISDELNDILVMIFERNPEERITVSQLKRRIFECNHFTAPHQAIKSTAIQQQATPAHSPCSSDIYDSPSPASSCSDTDSIFSNAGLSDSSSDEEDLDSGYDSEDSAMEQDHVVPFELVESPVDTPKFVSPVSNKEKRPAVPYSPPTVQFPQQQYVLPQESSYPVSVPTKPNPYFQYWAPYQQHHFERLQAVPQVYQPCYTPPPQHYPVYVSQSQFTAPSGWY